MGSPGPDGPRPHKAPAIIRTRPPGAALPHPPQAGAGFDRTAGLVHELGNILDGSMRQVNLALRSLGEAAEHQASQADLDRRLRIVRTALEQMAGLISAAARPPEESVGDRFGGMTLADAIRHAASILEPEAGENRVRIQASIDPRLENCAARGAYCVVLNALRNALDSCRSGHGTRIELQAAVVCGRGDGEEVVVEVRDDGPGPRDGATLARAFDPGFTTKKNRPGLGLALARDVVRELGGCIALRSGDGGVGAVFEARWPMPAGRNDR